MFKNKFQVKTNLEEELDKIDNKKSIKKLIDPKNYLILPGKDHGAYEYPDTLISLKPWNYKKIMSVCKKIPKLNKLHDKMENEFYESKRFGMVSAPNNISWNKAFFILKSLEKTIFEGDHHFMLTPRQYIDLIHLVDSEQKLFDGNGKKLSFLKKRQIKKSFFKKAGTYGWQVTFDTEWMDAKFVKKDNLTYIEYEHKYNGDILIPKYSEPLEDNYNNDPTAIQRTSYCSRINNLFRTANHQGYPTKKTQVDETNTYITNNKIFTITPNLIVNDLLEFKEHIAILVKNHGYKFTWELEQINNPNRSLSNFYSIRPAKIK